MGSVHLLMFGCILVGFALGLLVSGIALAIFGGEEHDQEPR